MGYRKWMGCESMMTGCDLPEIRVYYSNGSMCKAKTPLLGERTFWKWFRVLMARKPVSDVGGGIWVCAQVLIRVWLFATPWTVAARLLCPWEQEYSSKLPFPSPRDLSNPGIEPGSLTSPWQAGSLPLVPPGKLSQIYLAHFYHLFFFFFSVLFAFFKGFH